MTTLEKIFYSAEPGDWYREELLETYEVLEENAKALEQTLTDEQKQLLVDCEMYFDELIDLIEKANFSHGFEIAIRLMNSVNKNNDHTMC